MSLSLAAKGHDGFAVSQVESLKGDILTQDLYLIELPEHFLQAGQPLSYTEHRVLRPIPPLLEKGPPGPEEREKGPGGNCRNSIHAVDVRPVALVLAEYVVVQPVA